MKFLKGIILTFLVSTAAAKCGNGHGSCPSGECCSEFGYCGSSSDYCGKGCQPKYGKCYSSSSSSHSGGRCGSGYGSCPSGECCSEFGYCGTSSDHCGYGCQYKYGKCHSSHSGGRCGSGYGSCPSGECCSEFGYCGKSSDHCGSGCQYKYGECHSSHSGGRCGSRYGSCPSGECCSEFGYCGKSSDYCGYGCQYKYGECHSSSHSKKGLKYYNKCKKSHHWALTFDDGPYIYDEDLLDLLKRKGVKATFFINGKNNMDITKAKSTVKRIYREGHVIGSHTWSHPDLRTLGRDDIRKEMTKLEDVLEEYIGKKPAFVRPPFGGGNENEYIAKVLGDIGYTAACMWNVDTLDWENKGNIDYAISQFRKMLGNSIISLNHNVYVGSSKEKVLNLVEAEIDYMLRHGYKPVTMDECLDLDAYQD